MPEANLEVKRKQALSVQKIAENSFVPQVTYHLSDSTHYVFEHEVDENTHVRMDESNQEANYSEFTDAEFDEQISDSDKIYYVIAAASGLLTGSLSLFHLKTESLENISEWTDKVWKDFIILAARVAGYKKGDYKGAAHYLQKKVVQLTVDHLEPEFREALLQQSMNLACNPTKAGLAFSIITQFSEKSYSFNSKEELKESNLPDYYAIGTTTADKLMFGLLYWVFNIVAQSAVSARPFLEEIGLPKQLLSVIRELTQLKLSKSIPTDYVAAEKMFSEWLVKTFEDTEIVFDDGNEKFNLVTVLKECLKETVSQSGLVVLNECIFRGFYTLRQLYIQIREKKITSVSDFNQIDMRLILPVNNRVISRMSLIASGTFAGVNITGAVLKAIAEEKKDGRGFAEVLRAEINVAGIGRFIFAVASDSKYWAEDIKIAFSKTAKGKEEAPPIDADAFDCLTLNPVQARILYSMEAIAIRYDIAHTDNPEDANLKQTWMEEWKNRIVSGFGYEEGYFVEAEEYMYDGFFALSKQPENRNWFYLMTMELALFKPYHDLGSELDSKYKKLKRSANYVDDCFARKQTIVSQGEIDAICDAYKKYKGVIDGSRDGNIIKGVAVVVGAAAAGGMAFVFAPSIAVALAGEAVVGLHGAALTSASLAFVGGGSLAAGGLGMAGGTAIITGGGALVGLLGTGTASIATVLAQTPVEYWIRQSAKLLTYSNSILIECFNDKDSAIEMRNTITGVIAYMERKQTQLEEENITLDKAAIKSMKEYIKYLKRCESELKKLTK